MTPHRDDRSLGTLISDLVQQLSTLVQTEGKLLRSEVRESGRKITAGGIEIVAGAGLLVAALVILLQAGVAALVDYGMEQHWAALIVGGATLLLGAILAMVGINRLKGENLAPTRTIEQLQRDAAVAKQQVR
jgi:hypothetical protein